VYDIVREVPPSLRTLAHQGAKSYGESCDLIHRREASKPNSIWQADHAQLDIKLLKEDGSTARLLLLTLFVVDFLELFVVVSRHFFSSDQITDG
jgi:putative transposase